MEENESIDHAFMQKIEVAANINTSNLAPQLFQLIGYRQKVAQMIQYPRGQNKVALKSEFNYVNDTIFKILGL